MSLFIAIFHNFQYYQYHLYHLCN